MLPWGHLAFGYLLDRFGRRSCPPASDELAALALGTQAPDLVDKPAAWVADVLPAGQCLAHSLLVGGPALVALDRVAGETRRPLVRAFAVGYLSHLAGDALRPALRGDGRSLTPHLWPLLTPRPDDGGDGSGEVGDGREADGAAGDEADVGDGGERVDLERIRAAGAARPTERAPDRRNGDDDYESTVDEVADRVAFTSPAWLRLAEVGATAVAFAVWWRDGAPGVDAVRRAGSR